MKKDFKICVFFEINLEGRVNEFGNKFYGS